MDDLGNMAGAVNTDKQEATPKQAQAERDEKGRFGKGNRGGPGNPFARQTAQLRQAALEAVSAEDMRAVMNALKEKAKTGDVAAIRLLLSYTVGKPTAAADPDTLDQHELQTMVNNHVRSAESAVHVVQGMPLDALVPMLRAALPHLFKSKMQMAHQVLSTPPAEEDDDDDLELEVDAQGAANGPANSAVAGTDARNDNIPAWMYEMVNADRAQQQGAGPQMPKRRQEKETKRAQALDEIQQQLLDLLNEQKKRRTGANEQETGQAQNVDGGLLYSLRERMQGILASQDNATSPTGNGPNGAVEPRPST